MWRTLFREIKERQLNTKPWANRQPTNHARGHVPCKAYRWSKSVRMCVPFYEAGLRECLYQDRRGRARTLPTHLPGPTNTRSIPRAGDRERGRWWDLRVFKLHGRPLLRHCVMTEK